MGYRILHGLASIDGKSPDGDTIAFKASHLHEWMWPKNERGRYPRFDVGFRANIRLEGIDALELHYPIPDILPQQSIHQPLALASQSRDRMLRELGFNLSGVSIDKDYKITDSLKQELPVTLAYNGIDPYGRVIGFVYKGHQPMPNDDDSETHKLTVDEVCLSVNAMLLKEGLVFPTFYSGLYPELRSRLRDISKAARETKAGLWQTYSPTFILANKPEMKDLENLTIFPKLFRRLSEHIAKNGGLSNFKQTLIKSDDTTVDLVEVRISNFASFIHCSKPDSKTKTCSLKLIYHPEDLVFLAS